MSDIADQISPDCLLLCNESFASTNEREGSEIARQVVRAMLDKQVRVVFVTHMYDLAHGFHAQQLDSALFLRAEREPDGRRTFRLARGRAAADQLRRGLLPADLRYRKHGAGNRRRRKRVTCRAARAADEGAENWPRP